MYLLRQLGKRTGLCILRLERAVSYNGCSVESLIEDWPEKDSTGC
jgi:hypothetical protein